MLKSILLVGVGSFLGGVLRFLVSLFMRNNCSVSFPWATLTVNLIGAFVIGVIYALFARYSNTAHAVCLLLTTGLCGGFTTFSAFAYEGLQMLQSGNVVAFVVYALSSVIAGVVFVALGYWLVNQVF